METGVIGCGPWGGNHIRAYVEIGAKPRLISDVDEKLLGERMKEFGLNGTVDYHEILKDKEIMAVSVCTPASTHYKITMDCLRAGKNVLVEKPLAMTSREGGELCKLAEKKGLVLMVGHIYRFDSAIRRARQEIEKGTFGKVYYISLELMGLKNPRSDCGAIFNYGVHELDIMSFLLGEYPEEVSALTINPLNTEREDFALIGALFKEGTLGYAQVSWLPPGKWRDIWVVGEKASGFIDTQGQIVKIFTSRIEEGKARKGTERELHVEKKEPLKEELRHFLECIKTRRTPISNGEVGLRIIRVMEACLKSAKEKRVERVRYV